MRRLRLGLVTLHACLLVALGAVTMRSERSHAELTPAVASVQPAEDTGGTEVVASIRSVGASAAPRARPVAAMSVAAPSGRPVTVEEVRASWSPPVWFPEGARDALWKLTALDGAPVGVAHAPKVRARAAIVADLDRGEVLWARRADEAFPVASLTKVVSALALASADPDLDSELCVTYEQWPPRPGARSRFSTGGCHEGWEYVGAALVASDNRGAMAMASLSGLPFEVFIERMGEVSADLGMTAARWADPTGLEDEDMASARDMARAIVALSEHPLLVPAGDAPWWEIDGGERRRALGTTNRLAGDGGFDILAAKTGYTDTAGYCFTAVVRTRSGRTLALTVLGAPTNAARFADARALIRAAEG
jgi:D-alanyl-D-alanine endopeptidase (penicillin-binding protein 7)